MAHENDLYPYKVIIQKKGDGIDEKETLTGHAPTQGAARKHIKDMIDQRAEKDITESVVSFEFNGKAVAI